MDSLSDMPDCILLHIMEFMHITEVVRTCVLSKRWKHLWKHVTKLKFCYMSYDCYFFNKLVPRVLSRRDGSAPLHSLDFYSGFCTEASHVDRLMKYAASHDVQQFTMRVRLSHKLKPDFVLPPSIFSSRTLTFLKLGFWIRDSGRVICPKSLELPALKSLHLEHVTFISTSDDGFADPFAACNMLDTLVIDNCYLHNGDANVLCITNSKLSSLTIESFSCSEETYRVTLSTPKLSSLTIKMYRILQLSSTCKLPFLEEANIDFTCFQDSFKTSLLQICLLQVLTNVKILTICYGALVELLNDLSNPGLIRIRFPCFVKLKSLTLKRYSHISHEEISKIVGYFLQNSSLAEDDIIIC